MWTSYAKTRSVFSSALMDAELTFQITGIEPSLPTHVVVTVSGRTASQVLTVPPRPPDKTSVYLSEYM